jgi:hypothetical protein
MKMVPVDGFMCPLLLVNLGIYQVLTMIIHDPWWLKKSIIPSKLEWVTEKTHNLSFHIISPIHFLAPKWGHPSIFAGQDPFWGEISISKALEPNFHYCQPQ